MHPTFYSLSVVFLSPVHRDLPTVQIFAACQLPAHLYEVIVHWELRGSKNVDCLRVSKA